MQGGASPHAPSLTHGGTDRHDTRAADLAAERGRHDFILDTASGQHDLDPYLDALRLDGTLCIVGMSGQPVFDPLALLIGRKSLASAGSGGIPGTREMLDFCSNGFAAAMSATGSLSPCRRTHAAAAPSQES